MNKVLIAALLIGFAAAPAMAADLPAAGADASAIHAGKMLLSADGARLASISHVDASGAQIIIDGRVVTVPTDTVKVVGGKLTTSLTKNQVIALP